MRKHVWHHFICRVQLPITHILQPRRLCSLSAQLAPPTVRPLGHTERRSGVVWQSKTSSGVVSDDDSGNELDADNADADPLARHSQSHCDHRARLQLAHHRTQQRRRLLARRHGPCGRPTPGRRRTRRAPPRARTAPGPAACRPRDADPAARAVLRAARRPAHQCPLGPVLTRYLRLRHPLPPRLRPARPAAAAGVRVAVDVLSAMPELAALLPRHKPVQQASARRHPMCVGVRTTCACRAS